MQYTQIAIYNSETHLFQCPAEAHRNQGSGLSLPWKKTWLPPFSLNLTNFEPDIIYCVEVFNITYNERELVVNNCHVSEPHYRNIILSPQLTYVIVITSQKNFVGRVNGSKLKIR